MLKWFKALRLGLDILYAIENFKLGNPAELSVEYKGKMYKLTLEQDNISPAN